VPDVADQNVITTTLLPPRTVVIMGRPAGVPRPSQPRPG